jgi:hypothetical protein
MSSFFGFIYVIINIINQVFTSYQVNDPKLTLDRLVYHHADAIELAVKEWKDTKTGIMASIPFCIFALTRIDKTIQDPVWEAAKAEQQSKNASNSDPTGQLPNQPHIEFIFSELYVGAPALIDPG